MILGWPLAAPQTKLMLYTVTAGVLVGTYLLCRFVVTSKLGRVLTALRDAELKTRFCGYESTNYKLFVWTLSAVLCALAGALYVPQVGIINPSEMQPSNSIEMAIWVAVGGRGTLVGAVVGALLVNAARSGLSESFPDAWQYFLGGYADGAALVAYSLAAHLTFMLMNALIGLCFLRRAARELG